MDALQIAYPILTPLIAAIVGGLVVHFGSHRRDVDNDRRRQRIDYLISAYRVLARSAHRDLRGDRAEAFEDALADIVLLGTVDHISLAKRAMQDLATEHDAPIDPLLVALRQGLRAELDLAADGMTAVPTVRMTWGEGPASPPLHVDESFSVSFDTTAARTRETLPAGKPTAWSRSSSAQFEELHALAEAAPGAAVVQAYGLVTQALTELLGSTGAGLDAVALGRLGVDRGVVAPGIFQSVEGLHILMQLSHSGGAGTGLTVERAHDYIELTRATLYALATSEAQP